MISLYEKELLAMKRELRDLKTYCQHGLGNTRFYAKEITIEGDAMGIYTVKAETAPGEPTPAILMAYAKTTPQVDFLMSSVVTDTTRTLTLFAQSATTYTIKAISTSNLTLEQTS